jgi:uncharacterized protein (TIGR03435 family)
MTPAQTRKQALPPFALLALVTVTSAAQLIPPPSAPDAKPANPVVASAVFEVASIKPQNPSPDGRMITMIQLPANGRLTAAGMSIKGLICFAYKISDFQVIGAPSWITSDRYDVEAKPDSVLEEQMQKMSSEQNDLVKRHMLQTLLADRFKLTFHRETREFPIYALVVAKGGPKLHESKPDDADPDASKDPAHHRNGGTMQMSFDSGSMVINAEATSIDGLSAQLSGQLHSTVQNQTGLKDNYDFTLKFAPEDTRVVVPDPANVSLSDSSGVSIFAAVQDQLGLKLESKKGPIEVLIVDHIDRPTEN